MIDTREAESVEETDETDGADSEGPGRDPDGATGHEVNGAEDVTPRDPPELQAPDAFSSDVVEEAPHHYQRCDHCEAVVCHVLVDNVWQCVNQHTPDLRQFLGSDVSG